MHALLFLTLKKSHMVTLCDLQASQELGDLALKLGSRDNITVMVLLLDGAAVSGALAKSEF